MEKQPSSWRGSNGGHEETLPLRGGGLETETRAPHPHAADQQEARRGRYRRNCVRAALVLCLLMLPAGVLLVWNLRADSSSRMLFDVDLPNDDDDDDDQGITGGERIPTCIYIAQSGRKAKVLQRDYRVTEIREER